MFHVKQPNKFYQDFLVTNEIFQLKPVDKYPGLLKTFPFPPSDQLSKYYESEDYISHSDDAKGLVNQLYYWVKSYNLKHKHKLIKKSTQGTKVLDYGCGTGEFVRYLNSQNLNAIGFEPNPVAFKIASEKDENNFYSNSEFLDNQKFDVITLWHVLEHIPNLFEELARLKNALNPNGNLFIAVPNYESFDAQYYQEYWAAYDVPRHLWHFNQTSFFKIANEFGMVIESIHPMIFDSFYASLLSEKYKGSSLGLLRAFGIGLRSNLKAIKTGQFSSLIYQLRLK